MLGSAQTRQADNNVLARHKRKTSGPSIAIAIVFFSFEVTRNSFDILNGLQYFWRYMHKVMQPRWVYGSDTHATNRFHHYQVELSYCSCCLHRFAGVICILPNVLTRKLCLLWRNVCQRSHWKPPSKEKRSFPGYWEVWNDKQDGLIHVRVDLRCMYWEEFDFGGVSVRWRRPPAVFSLKRRKLFYYLDRCRAFSNYRISPCCTASASEPDKVLIDSYLLYRVLVQLKNSEFPCIIVLRPTVVDMSFSRKVLDSSKVATSSKAGQCGQLPLIFLFLVLNLSSLNLIVLSYMT